MSKFATEYGRPHPQELSETAPGFQSSRARSSRVPTPTAPTVKIGPHDEVSASRANNAYTRNAESEVKTTPSGEAERNPPGNNLIQKHEPEFRALQEKYHKLVGKYEEIQSHLKEQLKLTELANANQQQAEHLLGQKTELLDIRSAELRALQTFYPMEDFVCGSDLSRMVNLLNDEIMQTSAIIARSLPPPSPQHDPSIVDVNYVFQKLRDQRVFGTQLRNVLERRNKFPNPAFPVQIALQACLAEVSKDIITSLYAEENDLHSLAENIERAEQYPVFAKWQAITHAELERRGATDPSMWLPDVVAWSCHPLAMAGWPEAFLESNQQAWGLDKRLRRLVESCVKLNRVIKQQVFSMRVHVIYPPYNSPFNPNEMEEAVPGAYPPVPGSRTLCTTGLGLTYEEVRFDGMGTTLISLKAKVATQPMFEAPAMPTTSKEGEVIVH
ncbi:hypothetical protein BDN72DRAFT_276120 [Pluteus cervinus]|uniref:Uncharacterized protein n=1 Tax=Pluteus cervinus TaxID=181527 RepID=A0ACD3AFD3_9AGAR|nr:hypothetical protein BDN72DRAFT_276120 [Pluteus cervinus]